MIIKLSKIVHKYKFKLIQRKTIYKRSNNPINKNMKKKIQKLINLMKKIYNKQKLNNNKNMKKKIKLKK